MQRTALKIGDLVFAGVGGEVFTEIGNRMRENSPYTNMILTCLTNSRGGYVPSRSAYGEGGYEAKSSKYKIGGDDILVDGMSELLKAL